MAVAVAAVAVAELAVVVMAELVMVQGMSVDEKATGERRASLHVGRRRFWPADAVFEPCPNNTTTRVCAVRAASGGGEGTCLLALATHTTPR